MKDELKNKAETVFYCLTKEAARNSFVDFLQGCADCSMGEWKQIKEEITAKTGIEFKYL